MKKALIVLGIALIVAFSGCVQGTGFGDGLLELKQIDARNLANDNVIVPSSSEELGAYKTALGGFRERISAEPETSDKQALLLLIDMRLDLVGMESAFIKGMKETDSININLKDCTKNSNAAKAREEFNEAERKARFALGRRNAVLGNYPEQAEKAGLGEGDNYALTLNAVVSSLNSLIERIDNYCAP